MHPLSYLMPFLCVFSQIRMQAQGNVIQGSMMGNFINIYQEEGTRGLWKVEEIGKESKTNPGEFHISEFHPVSIPFVFVSGCFSNSAEGGHRGRR